MRNQAGLTLTETLMTVAIAAVLLRLAVPMLDAVISHNQRVAATNALIGSVQYARSEADKRALDVVICPSRDHLQCSNGDAEWQHGWLVFADVTPDIPRRVSGDDQPLLVRQRQTGVTIRSNRPAFALRPFQRRSTNGTLVVCPQRAATPPRVLIVSYTGRPRSSDVLADGSTPACPDSG